MLEEFRSLIGQNPYLEQLVYVSLLVAGAALVYFVSHRVLVSVVRAWARRTQTLWDDALVEAEVFGRLAHLPPAMVVYYGVQFVPDLHDTIEALIQRVAFSLLIVVAVRAVSAFLAAANDLYSADPNNRTRPIKGYLQVLKLGLYLVAGLLVVATLMDRSPLLFLSGIGAMTAVLLLVFRDTILSLVASVQLTGNDSIHVGDWIEMPAYGADGDVIDIALHTVKVQNWDKTITAIPTHALVSDAFKNWRGMSQSGGRRIKRSLFIDVSSVRFLDADEIEALGNWSLLRDYVAEKRTELDAWNQQAGRNTSLNADIRRLTNIGTLRAYIERYLRAHPLIRKDMTLLVRQLQAADRGVPVEIYCFTNTTEWNAYEGIQADIFDHLLAVLPELGLRAYQSPAGADITSLAAQSAGDERNKP
jgi:miniconductance mechanosensitive channel